MNVCGEYQGSGQVFRSYSTNNLNTKDSQRLVPLRNGILDFSKSETNKESQGSFVPSTESSTSAVQSRERNLTMSGTDPYEHKSEEATKPFAIKLSKSFSVSNLDEAAMKKPIFKRFSLFDKKRQRSVTTSERSEHETQQTNVGKKKPLLLRSLSNSCLSLAGKTRPKLMNRLSCPSSLIVSPKQEGKKPTGDTNTTHVWARFKDSFKLRNSGEISKRDSRILVTRFELELAITNDDRSKILTFINSKIVNLNEKDYYGKTLLHTACSVGNYHCAQILIDAGVQVDTQDQAGFAPLHCAVVANHVPCAAVLIAAGADVMTSTRTMHTALTLAHEEEMILLIGRSLLLRGTSPQRKMAKKDYEYYSLRETNL